MFLGWCLFLFVRVLLCCFLRWVCSRWTLLSGGVLVYFVLLCWCVLLITCCLALIWIAEVSCFYVYDLPVWFCLLFVVCDFGFAILGCFCVWFVAWFGFLDLLFCWFGTELGWFMCVLLSSSLLFKFCWCVVWLLLRLGLLLIVCFWRMFAFVVPWRFSGYIGWFAWMFWLMVLWLRLCWFGRYGFCGLGSGVLRFGGFPFTFGYCFGRLVILCSRFCWFWCLLICYIGLCFDWMGFGSCFL